MLAYRLGVPLSTIAAMPMSEYYGWNEFFSGHDKAREKSLKKMSGPMATIIAYVQAFIGRR